MKTSMASGARRRKSGRESCSAAQRPGAVERFAGAHPPHCVGPLRLHGRGWPCLSIGLRPPGSLLHGYLIQTNGAESTSRKHQEAELRTRMAKHLSGRVRPPGAFKHTDHRQPITDHRPRAPSHANNHYLRPQSRTSVRI